MKCENCIALRNDSGYEHNETECWCVVGEEEIEFKDGSVGCRRKSIEKLKKDIKKEIEIEVQAAANDFAKFVEYQNWLNTRKQMRGK